MVSISGMQIREAELQEAPVLARIINAAFEVERSFKNGDRTTVAEIESRFLTGRFLVAEEVDRILGTVFVRITDGNGYFGLLAVDPAVQRGGIGRTLMQAAEDDCRQRGCKQMTMCIVDAREDLPGYYSRFGYEVTGTEPVPDDIPFTRQVHFVNMAKQLS